MFEAERENALANFLHDRTIGRLQKQLRDLLRDRRATFDDLAMFDVVDERARDRQRIDTDVLVEASIFRCDRRVHDVVRKSRQRFAASTCFCQRLVEDNSVSIDDRC